MLVGCAYKEFSMHDVNRVAKKYSRHVELVETVKTNDYNHSVEYRFYDNDEQLNFTVFESHIAQSIDGSMLGYDNRLRSDYQARLTEKYINLYDGQLTGTFGIDFCQAYMLYTYDSREELENAIDEATTIQTYLKSQHRDTALKIAYAYDGNDTTRQLEFYTAKEIRHKTLYDAIYQRNELLQEYTIEEIEDFLHKNSERVYLQIDGKWIQTNYIANDRGESSQYVPVEDGKSYMREYRYATMATDAFCEMLTEFGYVTELSMNELRVYDQQHQLVGSYQFNALTNAEY